MGPYSGYDAYRTLTDRIADGLTEKIKHSIAGDVPLRAVLKELQEIVKAQAQRQLEEERTRDSKAHRDEIDRIQSAWEADVKGRSDYLTQIERRRAQLHSALLLVNMRLQTIIALCPDNEFKAAILDVLADIKDAISKQQTKEEEPA